MFVFSIQRIQSSQIMHRYNINFYLMNNLLFSDKLHSNSQIQIISFYDLGIRHEYLIKTHLDNDAFQLYLKLSGITQFELTTPAVDF